MHVAAAPAGNCGHVFCSGCLAGHLSARLAGAGAFPPPCPAVGCRCVMAYARCAPLLPQLAPGEQELYLMLVGAIFHAEGRA